MLLLLLLLLRSPVLPVVACQAPMVPNRSHLLQLLAAGLQASLRLS